MRRPCRLVRALCFKSLHLGAIGRQQLAVARKVICPVAGEAALALGAQGSMEFAKDRDVYSGFAARDLIGPKLDEARQVSRALKACAVGGGVAGGT